MDLQRTNQDTGTTTLFKVVISNTVNYLPKGVWILRNNTIDSLSIAKQFREIKNNINISHLSRENYWVETPFGKVFHSEVVSEEFMQIFIDKGNKALNNEEMIFACMSEKGWNVSLETVPNLDIPVGSYETQLGLPVGLHPKLHVHLKNLHKPEDECSLQGFMYIPPTLFIDRYELSNIAEMHADNLGHVLGIWGETDLEAPSYKLNGTGSFFWFDIYTDDGLLQKDYIDTIIPLHTRYQSPLKGQTYLKTSLTNPKFFWNCDTEDKVNDFRFLFSSKNKYTLQNDPTTLSISIPIADLSYKHVVEWVTNGVAIFSFFYLLLYLWKRFRYAKD
ncbi:pig-X, glycosylphosphatidylinositol-mannosyltransferase I complex subunit [Schizosaccharomyces pombe]|uniref:Protein pbn1 n=1 Tax=Schizosaccharomyces pombe (strain 972 / ATCC 24843) TaxID=284812 RepID=PBN1_SCHPO|nr:putative GPI synthesis protein pig-X [Schizosaccharomyces pombe]O94472.1 RecName: Full=Protein pbn1 [Schizosaccharomyces pombe 972h-]CAA22633.1 pig-X (predicted) [Schizosaccharomyces pombe]|eukprot:NP_588484.1 putative GPI synthesis protein pig-X [Schizosaccharomyces pombe]